MQVYCLYTQDPEGRCDGLVHHPPMAVMLFLTVITNGLAASSIVTHRWQWDARNGFVGIAISFTNAVASAARSTLSVDFA